MKDVFIRLQEIKINNFKNVEKGSIAFQNFNNIKKNMETYLSDVLGIYGQNGSGKTALVDSMALLKEVMSGNKLNKNIINLINSKSDAATLEFTFLIKHKNEKFLVYYTFEIRKRKRDGVVDTNKAEEISIEISKESLCYSSLVDGKWKNKIKIIEYDVDDNSVFKPICRYNELINLDEENGINLRVAKKFAQKDSTSFIFNKESIKVFENFKSTTDYTNVIKSLNYFAQVNLFTIKNDHLGIINMSQLMPFSFRLENTDGVVAGNVAIELFETSVIPTESYTLINRVIEQINIVINAIIPGLQIEMINYGDQLLEDGSKGVKIELTSARRNERPIPLKYESDGIKKIISILSAMIAMYNNSSICLVVDELDAGIFEYLLGEILNVLEENAKGQFIFTSHNLRALEKLNKDSVIFTTTNAQNRYIRLTNVKSNNNLRDFYLRGISLGGQKECIYEETNSFEIGYAFKKAGKLANEN
ncbi:AAA family ATPase [Clostridium sp. BJN0001]|uniref:AAA family ATPase n=1 Tax=Clostridium sp. BJN0001 TaxID=2930219 RepID=UPI001FD05E02|nr:AAA family ATPase [Clostridium sp. BJN0001]